MRLFDRYVPDVRSRLVERIIFNFRVSPDVVAREVGVEWLSPHVVRGSGVMSFCVLRLDRLALGGLPAAPRLLGGPALHCARRFAVLEGRRPTVFIPARLTSSPLVSLVTRLGWPGVHGRMRASYDGERLRVEAADGRLLIAARLAPAPANGSALFEDAAEFGRFIAAGVRSYSRSTSAGWLDRIDLEKSETHAFEALEVRDLEHGLGVDGADVEFDAAFRTRGGVYVWRHHGRTPVARAARPERALALTR